MTFKESLKAKIEMLIEHYMPYREACAQQIVMEGNLKIEAYNDVLAIIDQMSDDSAAKDDMSLDAIALEELKLYVPQNRSYDGKFFITPQMVDMFKAGVVYGRNHQSKQKTNNHV